MSLKIAVLSSLTALGAFRAPAPAGDQAQNLGPVGSQEPLPTTVSRSEQRSESRRNRRPAAWRRGDRKRAERCPPSLKE